MAALATDVLRVLAGARGQARQMLRKLVAEHRINCRPLIDPDGTRGYHFRAVGEDAALLDGRHVTDGCVPEGILPSGTTFVVEGRAA